MKNKQKIEYAFYAENFEPGVTAPSDIKTIGQVVLPKQYTSVMKGRLFCHECFSRLRRTPESKDYDALGRPAYFAHISKFKSNCSMRTTGNVSAPKAFRSLSAVAQAHNSRWFHGIRLLSNFNYFATPNAFDTFNLIQAQSLAIDSTYRNSTYIATSQMPRLPATAEPTRRQSFLSRIIQLVKAFIEKFAFS